MVANELDKIINDKVPSHEALMGRFLFIDDSTLRTHIVVTFQYIIFLITLEEETELQGPVSYSIYKDIIVQSASIIESCLHYCLRHYIEKGKIDDIIEMKNKYKKPKQIYKLDNDNVLYLCLKIKEPIKFSSITDFHKINKMAKENKILTDSLFKDAEKMREDRNKIHLAGLTDQDKYFTKEDVQTTFNRSKRIIEAIESKLENLL